MENINTVIILLIILVIILVFTSSYKKETYAPSVIPFDYESPVKQMQLDKFYEHVIDNINNYDRYGDPIPEYYEGFQSDSSNYSVDSKDPNKLILNAEYYYNKYREYQDKVANLINVLVVTQDTLDKYKNNLLFCRRELTMKPIIAKCVKPTSFTPRFEITGNSIT